MITDYDYEAAQRLCEKIAADSGLPRFYHEEAQVVEYSRQLFENHAFTRKCLHIIETNESPYGHGLSHARKVAIDAGAIVLIEWKNIPGEEKGHRMLHLVHIAGVLHDLKRSSPDHARKGAKEADIILKNFGIGFNERKTITQAIENHEAFQPHEPLDSKEAQLLSDALYDADKFRWGPDNFTEMLWDIIIPRNVPLSKILGRFSHGLEAMKKIRETFRTPTGREYGPDFIDRGLKIGENFYSEITRELSSPKDDRTNRRN